MGLLYELFMDDDVTCTKFRVSINDRSCWSVRSLYSAQSNSNLHQTLQTGRYRSGNELITFEHLSASESGYSMFLKDSSTLRDYAFCNDFAHISGKTIRIILKMSLQMYLCTRTPCSFSELIWIHTPIRTVDTKHIRTSVFDLTWLTSIVFLIYHILFHCLTFDLYLNSLRPIWSIFLFYVRHFQDFSFPPVDLFRSVNFLSCDAFADDLTMRYVACWYQSAELCVI